MADFYLLIILIVLLVGLFLFGKGKIETNFNEKIRYLIEDRTKKLKALEE